MPSSRGVSSGGIFRLLKMVLLGWVRCRRAHGREKPQKKSGARLQQHVSTQTNYLMGVDKDNINVFDDPSLTCSSSFKPSPWPYQPGDTVVHGEERHTDGRADGR